MSDASMPNPAQAISLSKHQNFGDDTNCEDTINRLSSSVSSNTAAFYWKYIAENNSYPRFLYQMSKGSEILLTVLRLCASTSLYPTLKISSRQ